MTVPQILHATDPNQVASWSFLDADLGVGDRHLLVTSGIAIYNWKIDTDEIAHGKVRVQLGVFARELERASAFVGLASITNEESEFTFATDNAEVDLDESGTGELVLDVDTALQGESSSFNRFAYQVVASVVRIGTFIDGTINWPTSIMEPPSNDPSTVAPYLVVIANRREMTSGDQVWRPMERLTPITPGAIQSLSVQHDSCSARYRIDNPPMATPLKVTVAVQPGFAPGTVAAGLIAGPEVFTLSPFHTSETVDFALTKIVVT